MVNGDLQNSRANSYTVEPLIKGHPQDRVKCPLNAL